MPYLIDIFQVIIVDLVLAGDNAIIIALAVMGLPKEQRGRVLVYGIILATVLRIIFAIFTVFLLKVPGVMLFGGLLLFWVAISLIREIRSHHKKDLPDSSGSNLSHPHTKTARQAIWQIIMADVSMSLDNVLAVAAIARENLSVLVLGLILSVAFMGFAAQSIAKLLERHIWLAWVGVAIIFYVAGLMTWDGFLQW
jgi:YjbE family integral membrane protein